MRTANHRNGDTASGRHQQSGDFIRFLAASGMTQADLARHVDTHPNTVSRWATGKAEPPGAVLAYLRLYRDVKGLLNRG